MARYFDPSVYKIILVDQRGCGKSTPSAELTDNSTYDCVRDFEKIREVLGIRCKMIHHNNSLFLLFMKHFLCMFDNYLSCTHYI